MLRLPSSMSTIRTVKDRHKYRLPRGPQAQCLLSLPQDCFGPMYLFFKRRKIRRYSLRRRIGLYLDDGESYQICERPFHSPKKYKPPDEQDYNDGQADAQCNSVSIAVAKYRPSKALDNANHWIDAVEPLPFRRDDVDRIYDRGRIHPDLEHKR
jgi:hypothetical protein